MASQVDICNLALGWLGANLITSIDDDVREAALCKANYTLARDAVLEEAAWSFALTRAILPALVTKPVFGSGTKFQLPANCIRVIAVDDGSETFRLKYSVEGRTIVAGVSTLNLIYVAQVTDTELFTPNFAHALAARLALDLTIPITNSLKMQQLQAQMYQAKLRDAINTDALAGSQMPIIADSLIRVR